MEILKTVKESEIPAPKHKVSEEKAKLMKSLATLGPGEGLLIKLKNESEAGRISSWLKEGFKHSTYRLRRRTKNNELFGYIFSEQSDGSAKS